MNKKELKIEFLKGSGPGGQRKNKVATACRVTHIPTGVTAFADERSQKHSKKLALADIKRKLQDAEDEERSRRKKSRRDHVIHNCERIRTYDLSNNFVKDHRSGKKASVKEILDKGNLDLLR